MRDTKTSLSVAPVLATPWFASLAGILTWINCYHYPFDLVYYLVFFTGYTCFHIQSDGFS